MNANVKIALALVALVAAVIGVTVITQFSEGEPEKKPVGAAGAWFAGGLPLAFKDSNLYYNPQSDNFAMREFPGFFEVNAEVHWATFLLRNPNPMPVTVSAVSRNCTQCTTARLAVLPAGESNAMRRDVALAAAVGGLRPDPEIALHLRAEAGKLNWQPLDFDHPDEVLTVAPAVGPDTPTWCVLQLGFEVKANGPKSLVAEIAMNADGMKAPVKQPFTVSFMGDSAERVSPPSHDFGTLGEKAAPKSVEFYYWSTTRPQAALAPPKVGGIDGDPFLSSSAPVPLSADELDDHARRASHDKLTVRARGGYKFTLTLRREHPTKDGPRELDIGPFERSVTIGGQSVPLTATVTGLVALADGDAVNLGDFRGRDGKTVVFKLTSPRTQLELKPVNAAADSPRDHNPPGVTVTPVGEPVVENGVRRWTFKLTADKDALSGSLNAKLLVFRAAGTGQMVRVPMKGYANGK